MEIKECYQFAKVNMKARKKKTRINVALLSVSLLIVLLVNIGIGGLTDYINSSAVQGPAFRTITVSPYSDKRYDLVKKTFSDDERVEAIDVRIQIGIMETRFSGFEDIMGSLNNAVFGVEYNNIVMKQYFSTDKELKDDEIVIPKYIFDADYSIDGPLNVSYIESDKFIGQNIDFTYKNQTYSFKIVGVYDNVLSDNGESKMYVSKSFAQKLIEGESKDILSTRIQILTHSYFETKNIISEFYELTDSKKYTDSSEIENLPAAYTSAGIEDEFITYMEFIKFIGNITGIILMIWSSISIVATYLKDIKNRTVEFGVLKSVGYSNSHLSKILLIETLILSASSIIITLLIGETVIVFSNIFIKYNFNLVWQPMHFELNIGILLIVVIMGLLAPIVAYIVGINKIKHIKPIEALKTIE